MTTFARRTPAALLVLVLAGTATAVMTAQPGASRDLAGRLTALMTARQLDSFAVRDPNAADRFVAVLSVPPTQLLLVSAQYPAAAEIEAQLTHRNYREVYTALHQPAAQPTRFFLMDGGADGLRPGSDDVDVLYQRGTTQTLFDGRWKTQGLSEDAYRTRAQEAEALYSRLLSVLAAALEAEAAPGR